MHSGDCPDLQMQIQMLDPPAAAGQWTVGSLLLRLDKIYSSLLLRQATNIPNDRTLSARSRSTCTNRLQLIFYKHHEHDHMQILDRLVFYRHLDTQHCD